MIVEPWTGNGADVHEDTGIPSPPRSYAAKLVRVEVDDAIVTLRGELEGKSLVPEAVRLSRRVDGVIDVIDNLTYAVDDTQPPVLTEEELKRL